MESSPEIMVLQALKAATDQNVDLVKKAEQKLSEWEQQPGFFPTLMRILRNQQFDINVRWMAAVYLKNGVNRYWRKGIKNELPAADKSEIRQSLLENFCEPVPQVATQIALLIAQIARLDYPREWPDLVPVLLKNIQTTDSLQQQRVLLIFHHVIKALMSRRMMAERKMFEELTANIYEYIYDLWDGFSNLFIHSLENSQPEEAFVHMEKALLTLRTLRKLTISGYSKPQLSPRCMQFLQIIFGRLKQCLEWRYQLQRLNAADKLIELLEKFILKQVKTLNEFLEHHPAAFLRFVSPALEFSFNYVFHEGTVLVFDDGNVVNFPQFTIHCINLMKGILLCNLYSDKLKDSLPTEESPVPLSEFFTSERICYICEKIVTHYFLLTQAELELWVEDAESFSQDDAGGDSWKYSLRPSVERLFLTVMNIFRTDMTTETLKYIRKAQQINLTPQSDLEDILLKDAIYYAAGLASFNLFDEIDFDMWFTNQLLAEIKIDSDNFRILRRRAIWLTAQWAAVKFSRDLRTVAYEACLHLLRPAEDMSIRLESSKTLAALINSFEFEPDPFNPYLEQTFSALFVLLTESKECDTKMNVLSIINGIVEKMSDHVQSQADNLIAYLPVLWTDSEDHSMLRCSIICTLQQIIKALHETPEPMKPFLYVVIGLSTDIKEPSHIYLMEEGLSLWLSVMENSTVITPQLLDICKNLLPIIEGSSENFRTILFIIQAYILLCPRAFLERYGKQFVDLCSRMLDDIRPEGIVVIMKVFETMLKADSAYGLDILEPVLPHIFRQIYDNKEFPMVMSTYLTIVARVLIINQSVFSDVILKLSLPNSLETIIDVWNAKMPLVSELEKRKLLSLALASLFTVNNVAIHERFPASMQNISEVLSDVMKEEDAKSEGGRKYYDCLVFQDENDLDIASNDGSGFGAFLGGISDGENQAHHYDRCRQLSLKDPVHTIVLKDYVGWQLNSMRSQLGDMGYQYLMNTVYPGVLTNMSEYLDLSIIPKAVN
ncbi:importin-11 [Eupeodes corollae]|uniref:importin-11 n=1 Tax=Eupeodes corollae TaxID=290404 RepID=UPI002493AAD4|nr:importin-11 [Eupeodes corollae]